MKATAVAVAICLITALHTVASFSTLGNGKIRATTRFSCVHRVEVARPATNTRSNSLRMMQMDHFDMLTALLQRVDKSQAKAEFFFFFFGGSGALGIGFAQLPRLLESIQKVQTLGGGKTKGGNSLSVSPLASLGYPEQLKVADVTSVIKNVPSSEKISAKGEKKNYMAQLGYLERQAFYDCLPNENPLAKYAVFEALSGGNGDMAAPQILDGMLAEWRQKDEAGALDAFKSALLVASLKKNSAYAVFFLLIALVLDLIVESGQNAFL